MEGTYDDDFHRDAGFETWEDWFEDAERRLGEEFEDKEEIKLKKLRYYLRNFVLKKCTNSNCNGKMILKYSPLKDNLFWGCSEYPKCQSASSIFASKQTITNCCECKSYYKIDKIYSLRDITFVCENQKCNDTIVLSVDKFL